MSIEEEFHYRVAGRVGGWRPGSHAGSRLGAGQQFATHMSLYDWPDPRRLDLRASLRAAPRDWLVRVNRQRAGINVSAVVDVSASMAFGAARSKLQVAADFVEALGYSAFRAGDAVGMMAFDDQERTELYFPARVGRGAGNLMAQALRGWQPAAPGEAPGGGARRWAWAGGGGKEGAPEDRRGRSGADPHARTGADRESRAGAGHGGGAAAGSAGLADALLPLAGREGLVFLVSDFHWPLARLAEALDLLAHAHVVPLVVWDPAEVEAPAKDAPALLHDAETGALRSLWIRPSLRERWRAAVDERRAHLARVFDAHGLRPFQVTGRFEGEALSRYFLEGGA